MFRLITLFPNSLNFGFRLIRLASSILFIRLEKITINFIKMNIKFTY